MGEIIHCDFSYKHPWEWEDSPDIGFIQDEVRDWIAEGTITRDDETAHFVWDNSLASHSVLVDLLSNCSVGTTPIEYNYFSPEYLSVLRELFSVEVPTPPNHAVQLTVIQGRKHSE